MSSAAPCFESSWHERAAGAVPDSGRIKQRLWLSSRLIASATFAEAFDE